MRKVLSSAAQMRRRQPLAGTTDDYGRARSYVTEAGCKVIFNQRMKQSGMRWSRRGGQHVVDLRTACRSRLWDKIWSRGLDDYMNIPETNSTESQSGTPELSKSA